MLCIHDPSVKIKVTVLVSLVMSNVSLIDMTFVYVLRGVFSELIHLVIYGVVSYSGIYPRNYGIFLGVYRIISE